MKRTKVFILGAGASKPAGAPLLKELLGEGFHLHMGTASMNSPNRYPTFIKLLESEYRTLKRSEDWILLAEETDIEKILSSIDEKIRKGDKSLAATREEAVRFVYERLEEAVIDGRSGNCYPEFIEKKSIPKMMSMSLSRSIMKR